jgi:hypothetical protein
VKFYKLLARFAALFLSNFSAQNLLINSHQASHQIAAHPVHHLPMGLPDDNPSSFGHHCGIRRHAAVIGINMRFLIKASYKPNPVDQHGAQMILSKPLCIIIWMHPQK